MKNLLNAGALALLVAASVTPAQAEPVAAFVVGQSLYSKLAPISGAATDARETATALTEAGVKVVAGTNLTRIEWDARLREFRQAVSQAETAVFFFAGHSIAHKGRNYLVPVDARAEDLKSPTEYLIDTSELLSIFKSVRQTLIVWDGCWLLSRDQTKGTALNATPCADSYQLLAPRSVSVTRSSLRLLQPVDSGVSVFGGAVADALRSGVGPALTAGIRIQETHHAKDQSVPPLASTLLPADGAAMPSLSAATEQSSKLVAESVQAIVSAFSDAQLAAYADVPAIVSGLRAAYDRTAPAPSEEAVLIAGKLIPQLARAGVKPDPAVLAEYREPYNFGVGRTLGQQLQQKGVRRLPDPAEFGAALQTALTAVSPAATEAAVPATPAKPLARDAAVARAEGEKLLAIAAARAGALSSPSGLVYEPAQAGNGRLPLPGGTVTIHVVTTTTDGRIVEDTRTTGAPQKVAVAALPSGLQEALLLMREGGRLKLTVPSELAYGSGGSATVGPNEALSVDLELLKVE